MRAQARSNSVSGTKGEREESDGCSMKPEELKRVTRSLHRLLVFAVLVGLPKSLLHC